MASDPSTEAAAGGAEKVEQPKAKPAAAPPKKKFGGSLAWVFIRLLIFLGVLGGLWVWLLSVCSGRWGTANSIYYSLLALEGILLVWLFFEIWVLDVISSPPRTPGPETQADRDAMRHWAASRFNRRKWMKRLLTLVLMALLITPWAESVRTHFDKWGWGKTLFFSIPFVLALVLVGLFHKVMRARDAVEESWFRTNPDDPTCRNLLVVFNLSKKVLYFATVLASLVMALLIHLKQSYGIWPSLNEGLLGGIWLAIFFLNFLVEEYEVNLMAVLVGASVILATIVWVAYMGWTDEFIDFFRNFGIQIDTTGYLLIAGIFALGILWSIVKGAFHYVAITPNDINIQTGITESGRQLNREAFTTTVDAGDLLERIWGFGRIIVTFADPSLKPMELLVWNIKAKAKKLEGIRATYVVDNQQRTRL